jgi:hypothetical protein
VDAAGRETTIVTNTITNGPASITAGSTVTVSISGAAGTIQYRILRNVGSTLTGTGNYLITTVTNTTGGVVNFTDTGTGTTTYTVPTRNATADSTFQGTISAAAAINSTDLVNLGQFLSSNTTSGYLRLPNRIQICWVRSAATAIANNTATNITTVWPLAFTTLLTTFATLHTRSVTTGNFTISRTLNSTNTNAVVNVIANAAQTVTMNYFGIGTY